MQSFEQASAFVNAIGASGQLIDFRAIHDADKSRPAIPFRDTLENAWSSICHYNDQGYGIFAVVAAMDGNGRELSNVAYLRAHYVDLDNLSAQQNYETALRWYPAPSFAVQSSPNKFHVYWPVAPYQGNDRFQIIQRKLRQLFDGDGAVIDAARVMRLPGTINTKYSNPASTKYEAAAPHLVTCWSLPGFGFQSTPEALETALAAVNVVESVGSRHALGDPALAAPSLDWIRFALSHIDPNTLDRGEWISTTAAIKQAGWSLVTQEQQIFDIWSEWCATYLGNDKADNDKQWHSIRDTQVGWPAIKRRVPVLQAYEKLGTPTKPQPSPVPPGDPQPAPPPMPTPPQLDCSGPILSEYEQKEWFKNCVAIERTGEIMVSSGRFMNATKFNMKYGGKQFVISNTGKTTDEAWKAATRSTLWTIPKVDHTRFLPLLPQGEIVRDQLGRLGVNTYIPVEIVSKPGDVTPFLQHMFNMFPHEADRKILFEYFAHNVKFPGAKIRWAPMIQSTEGAGKTFFQEMMELILGEMYCYRPKAEELIKSGSTFNAWMRAKLFIVVNEIKVDERRELIEILKPMITDKRVEIQSKGVDQEMEDNPANWVFFSNYKDAIPVTANGRRYAIFYSAIQSVTDLHARGMDDPYFNRLFAWLHNGGSAYIADWLKNYPIELGEIAQRAPLTSSTSEALQQSRSPIELKIMECVADGLEGFRGGFVSMVAVMKQLKTTGIRTPMPKTVATVLESMGYTDCGRAVRPYFQEDALVRSQLFHIIRGANVADYGRFQGYES